jgi:hypothetical protein
MQRTIHGTKGEQSRTHTLNKKARAFLLSEFVSFIWPIPSDDTYTCMSTPDASLKIGGEDLKWIITALQLTLFRHSAPRGEKKFLQ